MYGDDNDSGACEWQRQQEAADRAWRERDEAAERHAQDAWDRQNQEAARGWRERDEACQRSATEYESSVRETIRQTQEKRDREYREQTEWEAKDRTHRAFHEDRPQWASSWPAERPERGRVRNGGSAHVASASSDGSVFVLVAGAAIVVVALFLLGATQRLFFKPYAPTPVAPVTRTLSYADFSAPAIKSSNVRVIPHKGFEYNSRFPNIPSWRMIAPGAGFHATFVVPASGRYDLLVTHLTSYEPSCPGSGYSPVTIRINSKTIAANYDAAARHGGTHGMVTDTWPIVAHAGGNTLDWTFLKGACTHYWIQRIEVQSAVGSNDGDL